jgi:hypothetical protein
VSAVLPSPWASVSAPRCSASCTEARGRCRSRTRRDCRHRDGSAGCAARPADYLAGPRPRARSRLLARFRRSPRIWVGRRRPERISGARVTPSTFAIVRTPASRADAVDVDGRAGAEPVVVLSHEIWTRRFAGDRAILGQAVRLDGVACGGWCHATRIRLPRFGRTSDPPSLEGGRGVRGGEALQVFDVSGRRVQRQARPSSRRSRARLAQEAPETDRRASVGSGSPRSRRCARCPRPLPACPPSRVCSSPECGESVHRPRGDPRTRRRSAALGASRGRSSSSRLPNRCAVVARRGDRPRDCGHRHTHSSARTRRTSSKGSGWTFRLDLTVVGFAIALAIVAAAAVVIVPALRSASADVASALRDGAWRDRAPSAGSAGRSCPDRLLSPAGCSR